jgi:hypothetical protein
MQPDEQNDLTPADRELEAALKSLAPSRATRLDPVAAAFAAGSRSAQRQVRFWQSAAAAVVMIGVGSWLVPFGHRANVAPPPPLVATSPPPAIAVATTAPPSPPASLASQSLVTLQHAVYENGVDGLPQTQLPTVRDLRVTDLF